MNLLDSIIAGTAESKQVTCCDCSTQFNTPYINHTAHRCTSCWEIKMKQDAKQTEQLNNLNTQKPYQFSTAIPQSFLKTSRDHTGFNLALLEQVEKQWDKNLNLAIIGESGLSKSRIISRFVKMDCKWVRSVDIARAQYEQHSQDAEISKASKQFLDLCRRAKHLVIDDLGKGNITESFAIIIYDIFDHRMSNDLATYYTANTCPSIRFSDIWKSRDNLADSEEALHRRLLETTQIFTA